MTAPTDQEIAELRRLLGTATPGPWKADSYGRAVTIEAVKPYLYITTIFPYQDEENAALIVAMRNTLTGLLDACEARGKEIDFERRYEEYGVVRVQHWPEGLVIWVGGQIVWRSWAAARRADETKGGV